VFNKIKAAASGISERAKTTISDQTQRAMDSLEGAMDQSANLLSSGAEISERAKAGITDRTKRAKDSLEGAMNHSSSMLASGKEKSKVVMEKHWPTIEKVLVAGLLGIAEEKLRDEEFLKAAFGKGYEILPIGIRIVLPRETFVSYCLGHREPIARRLEGYKSEREDHGSQVLIEHDKQA
jgi:hypothetical protein